MLVALRMLLEVRVTSDVEKNPVQTYLPRGTHRMDVDFASSSDSRCSQKTTVLYKVYPLSRGAR